MRNIYYILKDNESWKVAAGATILGPYDTRTEAIRAAVEVAEGAMRNGRTTQIMAQVEDPSTWERIPMSGEESAAAE